jgi:hypothetical protein
MIASFNLLGTINVNTLKNHMNYATYITHLLMKYKVEQMFSLFCNTVSCKFNALHFTSREEINENHMSLSCSSNAYETLPKFTVALKLTSIHVFLQILEEEIITWEKIWIVRWVVLIPQSHRL